MKSAQFANLALVLSLAIAIACVSKKPEEQTYSPKTDPGPTTEGCCGVAYAVHVSGFAPANGAFYWLGIVAVGPDSLLSWGEPVYLPPGLFSSVPLQVPVSYLDELPAGDAVLRAYVSDSAEAAGREGEAAVSNDGGVVQIVNYADSVCMDCCTKGLRRYGCWAAIKVGNCNGAVADVKTRYGRLCGEGSEMDTASAQMNAFVGIQNSMEPTDLGTDFLQIGYMIYRSFPDQDTFIYVEYTYDDTTTGATRWRMWEIQHEDASKSMYAPVPEPESVNRFSVTVVGTSVRFGYGDRLYVWPIPRWQGRTVKYAVWQGEIKGRETDMPGSRGNPCTFDNCYYYKQGEPNWASFSTADDIDYNHQQAGRLEEWGVSYTGDKFSIWDENRIAP